MTWYEMKWYDIIWYDIWMVRLKHCSETLTMGIHLSIESLWQIPAWLPDQSFHDGSSSILERHIFMKIQGYAKIQMGGPLFRSGSPVFPSTSLLLTSSFFYVFVGWIEGTDFFCLNPGYHEKMYWVITMFLVKLPLGATPRFPIHLSSVHEALLKPAQPYKPHDDEYDVSPSSQSP